MCRRGLRASHKSAGPGDRVVVVWRTGVVRVSGNPPERKSGVLGAVPPPSQPTGHATCSATARRLERATAPVRGEAHGSQQQKQRAEGTVGGREDATAQWNSGGGEQAAPDGTTHASAEQTVVAAAFRPQQAENTFRSRETKKRHGVVPSPQKNARDGTRARAVLNSNAAELFGPRRGGEEARSRKTRQGGGGAEERRGGTGPAARTKDTTGTR